MRRAVTVADLFCGAGGTSTGAQLAIEQDYGRSMDLVCVNHWTTAIETHKRMHPKARHYCADLATVLPLECVPSGKLDLLTASPTCTHHSRARGGRPTSDQQRIDPWHIVPWVAQLKVGRVLFENVIEYMDWGPVNPRTGKPIKSKKGTFFDTWWAALLSHDYEGSWRKLNCADYGDATTRVRWFGQLRHKSLKGPIHWPEPTHGNGNSVFDLKPWRSARECIDWSLRGRSIYGRKKELSPKTILRIWAGITKFNWPERYQRRLRGYMEQRGIEVPPAKRGRGTATPFGLVLRNHADGRSLDLPAPAIMSGGHLGLVEPFILAQGEGGVGREVGTAMPTIPGGGAHALIAPYYGTGSGESAQSVDMPLPTATAKARFGLIVPSTHGGGLDRARSVDETLPTITAAHRGELAFISSNFGEREGQEPRVRSVGEPTPSLCAQGYTPLVDAGDDDDILYRMLQWPELARATSFTAAGRDYNFAGNVTQITKQIGNAVPIETARALVRSALWDLAPAGAA